MENISILTTIFPNVQSHIIEEIESQSLVKNFPEGSLILREGEYVRHLPFLINGMIKIYSINGDNELLYYFIEPGQTCIMSFLSIFGNRLSKIYASIEEKSEVLLIPSDKIKECLGRDPHVGYYFFEELGLRYDFMMKNVYEAVFFKLDKRILEYIQYRCELLNGKPLKISHKEIAKDLGTAREVVCRILKKFETEGIIVQTENGIQVLNQQ